MVDFKKALREKRKKPDDVIRVICGAPGFGQQNQSEESEEMLPRPVSTQGSTVPGRSQNWLRDTDVSKTPQKWKIADCKADDSGRSAVIVKLQAGDGTIRFDSLKTNNPNFKILFDGLGPDEKKWKGVMVSLSLEWDDFSARDWRRYAIVDSKR